MDDSSFWADIKKFEDTLAKDPSSFCFAPLAELYRKTGLLDDAVSTALKGTTLHPDYVGGYMALGRAYLDKGLKSEALEALQRVVSFTPENMLAQKLLCQMYNDAGNNTLLRKTLEILLLLNPSDTESRILLESLDRISNQENVHPVASSPPDDSDFRSKLPEQFHAVEGLEELEPEEITVDTPSFMEQESLFPGNTDEYEEEADSGSETDTSAGIRTATIAELYVAQGHLDQAVTIYQELLGTVPDHPEYSARIAELEQLISGEIPTEGGGVQWSEGEIFSFQNPANTEDQAETLPAAPFDSAPHTSEPLLAALQGWLDTIQEVRECRSGRG